MKVKVTKVSTTDKKKDGTKLINKFGKPYFRVGIQVEEYPDEWINGFLMEKPEWEGKEIELTILEEEYNGKKQKKFQIPKKDSQQEVLNRIMFQLGGIHNDIRIILDRLNGKEEMKKPHYPTPDEEGIDLNAEDFPDRPF